MAFQQDIQIEAVDDRGKRVRYQTEGGPIPGGTSQVWIAKRLPESTEDDDSGADDVRRVALKVAYGPRWQGKLAEEAKRLFELQKRADECMKATGSVYRVVRVGSGPSPLTIDGSSRSAALIELEYLDGQTLEDRLFNPRRASPRTGETVLADTLRFGEEIAEALVQVETGGGGMFHRDIKPANLMVTSQGIRLFDFNVSRDSVDPVMTQVGTPGYTAPEVLTGRYDGRADLWSVGVTLWESLTGRPMDRALDVGTVAERLAPAWPESSKRLFAGVDTAPVEALLRDLITNQEYRIRTASELLQRLRSLRPAPEGPVTQSVSLDLIELLFELNPGGILSVVADTNSKTPSSDVQRFLRERMQIDDPLEAWLAAEVRTAAAASDGPTLFVLAGNAGDGKSHLLSRLIHTHFEDKRHTLERIRYIADATHVLDPNAMWSDRLDDFFAPFLDVSPRRDTRVHLIAMNTGMVVKYFDRPESDRFGRLRAELQRQLGLRRAAPSDPSAPWRVEVINLDLRNLLAERERGPSFFERMLDAIQLDNAAGIVAAKAAECGACTAAGQCPVLFNLRALALRTPRATLLEVLRRASLESDVHLSPRAAWGLVYRMVTGGKERYGTGGDESPCDRVRRAVHEHEGGWLREGHFTEVLFEQPDEAGPIWQALRHLDPAFATVRELDELHTRLSVKTELDNDPEEVLLLGGQGRSLAGVALDTLMSWAAPNERRGQRRDGAVRRRALFHADSARVWLDHEGAQDYVGLLDAYYSYSRNSELSAAQRTALTELTQMVQDVFLTGHGRRIGSSEYLRVSQPNFRRPSDLLVRVERNNLRVFFGLKRLVRIDPHCEAHDGRQDRLNRLGYRPSQLTLEVAEVRLTVDLPLYQFLARVKAGQKPSGRDLAQFQALVFIGNRLGNKMSQNELHIWDPDARQLHRLYADDFGETRVEPVAGG